MEDTTARLQTHPLPAPRSQHITCPAVGIHRHFFVSLHTTKPQNYPSKVAKLISENYCTFFFLSDLRSTSFSQLTNMLELVAVTFFVGGISGALLGSVSERVQKLSLYGKTLDTRDEDKHLPFYMPKKWFTHFYILAVALGLLSNAAVVLAYLGYLSPLEIIASFDFPGTPSMAYFPEVAEWTSYISNTCRITPKPQAPLTTLTLLVLGTIQASRRLYECWFVMGYTSSSSDKKATMLWTHYLVGTGFYVAVFCSLWAKGAPALLNTFHSGFFYAEYNAVGLAASLLLFVVASYLQYSCHVHLVSLVKYSLPTDYSPFRITVCPHYTAEVCVYLSYIGVALATHSTPNYGLLLAPVFTTAVLSASARNSREFYVSKFPDYAVRSVVIPWVL